MFLQFLNDANLSEFNSLGTIAIFCHKSGVDINELVKLADSISIITDEPDEDDEVEETTGQLNINNEEIGGFSISYSFVDDYLGPDFIEVIAESNQDIATKVDCDNIESLVEIRGALSPSNVAILEPIIDELITNFNGIAFIDEVGLFDKTGLAVEIEDSMYDFE